MFISCFPAGQDSYNKKKIEGPYQQTVKDRDKIIKYLFFFKSFTREKEDDKLTREFSGTARCPDDDDVTIFQGSDGRIGAEDRLVRHPLLYYLREKKEGPLVCPSVRSLSVCILEGARRGGK